MMIPAGRMLFRPSSSRINGGGIAPNNPLLQTGHANEGLSSFNACSLVSRLLSFIIRRRGVPVIMEPDTVEVGGRTLCRLHCVELIAAEGWGFDPCVEYGGIRSPAATDQFPCAKWGEPWSEGRSPRLLRGTRYCLTCEQRRQQWLADQR
jgi:hypothetical protein